MDSDKFSLTDFINLRSDDLFFKAKAFSEFALDGIKKGYEDNYLRQVINSGSSRVKILEGQKTKEIISMCSANYLGLSNHPNVIDAAKDAIDRYGTSVSSVPLIAGTTELHRRLELELAAFKKVQDVVLFPSGHVANTGVITALTTPNDWVVVDKLVHYSIIEGIRASRAMVASFRHNDPEHLKQILEKIRDRESKSGILVVIEGVYGIDGDIPPINDLINVTRQYNARLMVDDCHATGVLGKNGEGIISQVKGPFLPDIIMDSLSKALGSMGGLIGSTDEVVKYLRYYSKPVSFSVGLPAVSVAAALAALGEIKTRPDLVRKCQENAEFLKNLLIDMGLHNVSKSNSAIMSIIVGDELKLRNIGKDLFNNGVWVEGIPFPAMPRGQERIRLRVSAHHTKDDLLQVAQTIEKIFKKYMLLPKLASTGFTSDDLSADRSLDVSIAKSRDELSEVANFLWEQESQTSEGLAWYRIDDKIKYLSGGYAYHRENVKVTVFYARHRKKIVATATTFIDRNAIGSDLRLKGFIGCVGFVQSHENLSVKVLQAALKHLQNQAVGVVYAPVDVPMFIFGGGISNFNTRPINPFFQPYYPKHYAEIFPKIGFESSFKTEYYSFDLIENRNHQHLDNQGSSIKIREIDKLHWVEDAKIIWGILNERFFQLEHFYGIKLEEFIEMERLFLDLIYPDLWLIAEVDNKPVGFISAFPLCPGIFRQLRGQWGLFDLEEIRLQLERASEASIVWHAVSSAYKGRGIGQMLLDQLLQNMHQRGYTKATMTWEISDPDSRADDLVFNSGGQKAGYELEFWSCKLTT